MQPLTYGISLGHNYRKGPCQLVRWLINSRFRVCTSLAPKPMSVVYGLGTRLRLCMCTKLENGVQPNGQQPGAVSSFINQGEFVYVAMKMLSDRKALHCDKKRFCDKMTVSTWTVFETLLLNLVVWTRRRKLALSLPHLFVFDRPLRGFLTLVWAFLIIKALKEED